MRSRILATLALLIALIAPVFASPMQGPGAGSADVPGVVDAPHLNNHYTHDAPAAPGSIGDEGSYNNGGVPLMGGPNGGTNHYNGFAPAGMPAGTNPYATTSVAGGFGVAWFATTVFVLVLVGAMLMLWSRSAGRTYRTATDLR
jgi:hypothetical protein